MIPRLPSSHPIQPTAGRRPFGSTLSGAAQFHMLTGLLMLILMPGLLVGCRTVGHIEEVVATEEADRAKAWVLAGRDVSVRREVAAFDRVDVTDGLAVTLSIADVPKVEISGDEAHVALIESEVTENGRLNLRLVDPRRNESLQATVHVETPALAAVGSHATAEVSVQGLLESTLDASVSSNAHLALVGEVDSLNVEASSGGILKARDLIATEVQLEASSGAILEVHARDALRAELSSGATACYEGGDIRAEAQTSSGGSLTRCGPR